MGTPVMGQQDQQIWSLKVKKAGIKRLEFFKIGSLASLIGRPDERIHVGINAAFMHQRNFGRIIQH